jgi:hypothetical protein
MTWPSLDATQRRRSVANFDMVMPYDTRMETWLNEQGFPHPKSSPANRFPTKQEIFDAVARTGSLQVESAEQGEFFVVKKGAKCGGGYEIRIGCVNWDQLGAKDTDSITMHGYFKTELLLLELLSHKCGQLLLYPDTGDPAVIVHPDMDTEMIYKAWVECTKRPDSWECFYRDLGDWFSPCAGSRG